MKVCTVCNGGLFTSLMLEEATKKVFKKLNFENKATIEHTSANTFSHASYDLIIADRALAAGMNCPPEKLVVINIVTDDEEIEEKITKKLKEMNLI